MAATEKYTPTQSDNNNGTIGSEGGLPNRPDQKPFRQFNDPKDVETGNKEYDRHHKEDKINVIKPVSAEEEAKKGEINKNLPGNRPNNVMKNHSENVEEETAED